MKKYNRDKRGTYKSHIRRNKHTYDNCDTRDRRTRIHIPIRYDNYNKIEYIPIIYGKTRDTRAQQYVKITNAITDIFPEINAPHTDKVYRGTAPYRKYPRIDNTYEGIHERALKWNERTIEEAPDTIMKDTHRVKCIIYSGDKIIHIGILRRTRVINVSKGTREFTLHKGKRSIQVYEKLLYPDEKIHGITVKEIKAHDVEIYRI